MSRNLPWGGGGGMYSSQYVKLSLCPSEIDSSSCKTNLVEGIKTVQKIMNEKLVLTNYILQWIETLLLHPQRVFNTISWSTPELSFPNLLCWLDDNGNERQQAELETSSAMRLF